MKMYIDIDSIIKNKNPKLYSILPRFLISYIKKIVHQDDLNRDLEIIKHDSGIAKLRHFLDLHSIKIEVQGAEHLPTDARCIFASNHPLGGPDGIIFMVALANYYSNLKFIVNDLLMHIPDVQDIFIPTNKVGRNNKANYEIIDATYKSDSQVLIFPAGIVSRKKRGVIQDVQWRKSFIQHAKKYERDVIPVYIHGKNSKFFYNLARLRTLLGIKVNIEMFYLVHEMYKHTNETIRITFGPPISHTSFDNSKTLSAWAEEVKQYTYSLANSKA